MTSCAVGHSVWRASQDAEGQVIKRLGASMQLLTRNSTNRDFTHDTIGMERK